MGDMPVLNTGYCARMLMPINSENKLTLDS